LLEPGEDVLLHREILLVFQDLAVVLLRVGPVVLEVLHADPAGRVGEDRPPLLRFRLLVHKPYPTVLQGFRGLNFKNKKTTFYPGFTPGPDGSGDAVLVELVVKGAAGDAESLRGVGALAAARLEGPRDRRLP